MKLTLFRQLRELSRLQNAYYDSSAKDNGVIADYLNLLKRIRDSQGSSRPRHVSLHLGSGGHRIDGWINLDVIIDDSTDLVSDLRLGLPVKSASIQFIHSEDLIEHLDQESGRLLAKESFRVLRAGGIMRIVTPNLSALVKKVYLRRQRRHLRWCSREFQASTPCQALNIHMRMDGEHRFLYDERELIELLTTVGFKTRRVSFNRSPAPELRFLDLRNFGLSTYLEAIKPERRG